MPLAMPERNGCPSFDDIQNGGPTRHASLLLIIVSKRDELEGSFPGTLVHFDAPDQRAIHKLRCPAMFGKQVLH